MSSSTTCHRIVRSIRKRLGAWCADDRGQDLIEYALLASVVALVGFLGMQAIAAAMGTVYVGWDAAVQDAWEVPDPVGP
jgi:Flp pilus assembly pilin Flp